MHSPHRMSVCATLGVVALGGLFCLSYLFGVGEPLLSKAGQAPMVKPPEPDHKADRAAIKARTDSFIRAFEKGDAKAVASYWTPEGEYIDGAGVTIRGRANIEKSYRELFETVADRKVEVEMESLRFPSKDTAIEEGYLSVRVGDAKPEGSRYSVLHVREGDGWLMAVVREWPAEADSLRNLSWLIGSWKAERENSEVLTTYEWQWNKKFIRVQFSIKQEGRTLSGSQLIGQDPITGELRSWTFESQGGFGEAHWRREGKKWILDSAGVLSDGTTLANEIIITPLDNDTFVSHVVNRSRDGEELEDLAPIKVTRVKKQPE